ncbi:uncharacterized protein OCT59_022799 [Rhizophagus irregularis]|uniref:uncharacterized protein n=1 Tax=Rhizophagus irregularis TaxID=588596 RepID=UPI003330D61A|nr:hypothetical protein OCT59_022799 [Rhizophagus irregularis]
MRNALLFVTIYRGPVGVYLSVRIGETLRFGLISVRFFTVSVKPFHVSAKPFMYRRDPSLCIDIGWRGHLDGIISWKLGFLNKYRLEPLETKPVVSVATFGNETCSKFQKLH